MYMIKSLVVALMLSGTAAVLPQVATAQTQGTRAPNVPKSDFVALQKAYNQTKTTKDGVPSYERFNVLMRQMIAHQKEKVVASNEAPAEVEKYNKMTDVFGKMVKANRSENRAEITNNMTAFINLL